MKDDLYLSDGVGGDLATYHINNAFTWPTVRIQHLNNRFSHKLAELSSASYFVRFHSTVDVILLGFRFTRPLRLFCGTGPDLDNSCPIKKPGHHQRHGHISYRGRMSKLWRKWLCLFDVQV